MKASGRALDRFLLDLEPVTGLRRLPQPHARREQEALPRRRPDRVAEARFVVAALEPVATAVLDVRPADRQLGGGVELLVDDRAVAHGRADDGVAAGGQSGDERVERFDSMTRFIGESVARRRPHAIGREPEPTCGFPVWASGRHRRPWSPAPLRRCER